MYKTLLDIRTFDMWFMSPYLIASICAWISIKSGLGSRAFLWRPPWPLGGWTQLRRTFPDGLPEEDDKIRSNGPKGTSIYYVCTFLTFWPPSPPPPLLHYQKIISSSQWNLIKTFQMKFKNWIHKKMAIHTRNCSFE